MTHLEKLICNLSPFHWATGTFVLLDSSVILRPTICNVILALVAIYWCHDSGCLNSASVR